LALSAHALIGDKQRAIDVGFTGYLTKPIDIFSLLDDIREASGQP
jgi:CheY-like chemotaxis protein